MDYCSSCRRHLNGALVCPGCGAYAPDIDPAAYAPTAQTPVTMMSAGLQATTRHGDFDTWEDATPDTVPDAVPFDEADAVAAQPLAEGRAARRRQRARWKKNQRRAVVATAVALVTGSVTMVAMDQPGDRTTAAAAPEGPGGDLTEELAGQYGTPAAKRSDEPRSTATPAASDRSGRHADAGSARTAPSDNRTEMAAPPRDAQASVTRQRTTTPSTGGGQTGSTGTSGVSDAVQEPVTTPTSPTSPPPSTGESTPTQPPAAQDPATPPQPQDPRLCLLVICLG